jgi:hypothetical protein
MTTKYYLLIYDDGSEDPGVAAKDIDDAILQAKRPLTGLIEFTDPMGPVYATDEDYERMILV